MSLGGGGMYECVVWLWMHISRELVWMSENLTESLSKPQSLRGEILFGGGGVAHGG